MIKAHFNWEEDTETDNEETVKTLQQSLGVSAILGRLLVARGLTTPDEAQSFLKPSLQMVHDPHLLHDMDKAVDRIEKAVANGEKITVYGDYDADGITSTAVMYEALNGLGANVDYYIPDRFKDGYGPNQEAYDRIIAGGTSLIVTVDNGVSGKTVIERAMDQGVDVVITDHHELPKELPKATAIVHPRYPGSKYPFPDLSGVGVAFKVVWALQDEFPEEMLDLLAIGEIADLVDVTDENRALIALGIQELRQGLRPGLHALVSEAGVNESQLTDQDISFKIAPRLNALGRVANASDGVELLTTLDEDRGQTLAQQVEEANQQRRELVEQIYQDAYRQAVSSENADLPVLLLLGNNWHQGVLGIVASRIMEKTGKPTIVAGVNDGDTIAKASGRSIPGFNLFDALDPHRDLLVAFGGHPAACGLSFETKGLDALRSALTQAAEEQGFTGQTKQPVKIAAHLKIGDVTEQLYREVQLLAPFGPGNERPVFELQDVQPGNIKTMGKDNTHLKFNISHSLTVIAFNQGRLAPALAGRAGEVDLLAQVGINEWQGHRSVQLMLTDIQVTGPAILDSRTNHLTPQHFTMAGYYVVYDKRLRANIAPHVADGHTLSPDESAKVDLAGQQVTVVDCPPSLTDFEKVFTGDSGEPELVRLLLFEGHSIYLAGLPNRSDFASLYRFLARHSTVQWPGQRQAISKALNINEVRLNLMISVFSEVGFVTITNGVLNLASHVQKTDLKQTDHYQAQLAQYQAEQVLLFSDAGTLTKWVMQCLKKN